MIARAIVTKPKVLLFDEATSALDNITQKHVSDSLKNLKSTRIVIAHRLSTIKECDRIIVLDKGHIIEDGTYQSLSKAGGFFSELVERQKTKVFIPVQSCRKNSIVRRYPSKRMQQAKVCPYLLRNAVIDRPNQVWSINITYIPIKRGFLYLTQYNNIREARKAIGKYVHIYNFERCHSAFNNQTSASCYYPILLLDNHAA